MNKEQIIEFIEGQLAAGKISRSDLAGLAGGQSDSRPVTTRVQGSGTRIESSKKLISILYVIGALILLSGIVILIADNWDAIGFIGRILVTLGVSLVAYVIGIVMKRPDQNMISQVMFTVSAILVPVGSFVMLEEAGVDADLTVQTWIALIGMTVFATAWFISRRTILVLVTVAYATWAYYAVILNAIDFSYSTRLLNIIEWSTMIAGVAYILIAYGLLKLASDSEMVRLQKVLYGAGALAILGGGISIGGFFDVLYIAILFGAFYGSIYLRSRSMLILAALFLMGHIIKLSAEYFANSIGWSVTLILTGAIIIGVGYFTLYLNKKYISGTHE